jgi:putative peptidoglycan lipid II flippase
MVSGAPSAAARLGMAPELVANIGGNAAYTNAIVIFVVPHSLITVSLMTTLFTKISHLADEGDIRGVSVQLTKGINMIITLITFFSFGFLVLGVPIVRVLIPSANPGSTNAIALGVIALAFKLIPAGIYQMTSRVFFAFGKMKALFFIEIPEHLLIILLVFLTTHFVPPAWWVFGVSLSTTIGFWFATLLILRIAKVGILGRTFNINRIVQTLVKCALSGICSLIIGKLLMDQLLFRHLDFAAAPWHLALLAFVVVGLIMAVTYVLICNFLKVREIGYLLKRVRGRVH